MEDEGKSLEEVEDVFPVLSLGVGSLVTVCGGLCWVGFSKKSSWKLFTMLSSSLEGGGDEGEVETISVSPVSKLLTSLTEQR